MSTATGKTTVTQPDDKTVDIFRVFNAPRALVWKAWTDPKMMAQWFGPTIFSIPVCELDVRVGGAWRLVMRGPDGVDYPLKGVYREIVAPERIVTTVDVSEHPDAWHDLVNPIRDKAKGRPFIDTMWTVTFEEQSGKTKLTVRTHFQSTATRDTFVKTGLGEGWSLSLDKLESLLARAA